MSKPEDYLNQNIKGILQPMVKDMLSQRPKDAVNQIYIINIIKFLF